MVTNLCLRTGIFHDCVILCLTLQGGNRESRKKDATQALPGNICITREKFIETLI